MEHEDSWEIKELKPQIDLILNTKSPPVARCRLMSPGIRPYHTLHVPVDLTGVKSCLACGNCIDSCPILRREPERTLQTGQRTSMALESIIGEDCERCYSCALVCPQVAPNIKQYIVKEQVTEVIPQSPWWKKQDKYFMVVTALVFGIFLGIFALM